MAYEALARKYRPRTFEEVVGQDPIVRTLTNAITERRIHHAYVFSGVRGVGKTTVARIFAKALNCETGPTPRPCLVCAPCQEIAAGRDLDVIEMDAASRTGVDDVRDLIDTTRYAPARDRYKVFIIDEFHMLSKPAFNALLKTLEEPPPRVVFVMATTELQKVLPTVLSRTQQFDFRKVPVQQIADVLAAIAQQEGVRAPRVCLEMLARAGDGSVRDATSLLDQAIAFGGTEIGERDIRSLLGLAPEETVEAFLAAAGARDAATLLEIIAEVLDQGHDLRLFHAALIEGVRRLLVLKATDRPSEILGLAPADEARLAAIAEPFTTDLLLRLFADLARLEAPLRYSEQPRYLLEAAAVRIASLADLTPIEDLIARLEGGPPGPEASPPGRGTPRSVVQERRTRPAPAPSPGRLQGRTAPPQRDSGPRRPRGELDAPQSASERPVSPRVAEDEPDPSLAAFLDLVRERKAAVAALLENARVLRRLGSEIEVVFDEAHAFARKSVEQEANLAMLGAAAREALGEPIRISIRREPSRRPEPSENGPEVPVASAGEDAPRSLPEGSAVEGGPSSTDGRQQRLQSQVLENPAVRSVMKRFGGRIVELKEDP